MGEITGTPVRGEVDSADASSGVAFTLYEEGSLTSRTLGDDEYLEIYHVAFVTAAGGDVYVHVGPDVTIGSGETVLRGEFAANGGMTSNLNPPFAGQAGHLAYLTAPAGNVDGQIRGTIRRAATGTTKPSWKADDFGT